MHRPNICSNTVVYLQAQRNQNTQNSAKLESKILFICAPNQELLKGLRVMDELLLELLVFVEDFFGFEILITEILKTQNTYMENRSYQYFYTVVFTNVTNFTI